MEKKSLQEIFAEFNEKLTPHGVTLTEAAEQRTEDWHADRLGMFTGSRMGDLMSCSIRATKNNPKDWSKHVWLLAFGEAAMTYIIERAIERATGERIKTPTTWQMQWGIDHEEEGKYFTQEHLKAEIKEVSFIKFMKNAGASPDGVLQLSGLKLAYELKCPATMQSHYKLKKQVIDESHPYFWQFQSEMLALKVENLLFCSYDKRYPEAARLAKRQTQLSNVHARALQFRCIVAEKLVQLLVDTNFEGDIYQRLEEIKAEVPQEHDELIKWFETEMKGLEV